MLDAFWQLEMSDAGLPFQDNLADSTQRGTIGACLHLAARYHS